MTEWVDGYYIAIPRVGQRAAHVRGMRPQKFVHVLRAGSPASLGFWHFDSNTIMTTIFSLLVRKTVRDNRALCSYSKVVAYRNGPRDGRQIMNRFRKSPLVGVISFAGFSSVKVTFVIPMSSPRRIACSSPYTSVRGRRDKRFPENTRLHDEN